MFIVQRTAHGCMQEAAPQEEAPSESHYSAAGGGARKTIPLRKVDRTICWRHCRRATFPANAPSFIPADGLILPAAPSAEDHVQWRARCYIAPLLQTARPSAGDTVSTWPLCRALVLRAARESHGHQQPLRRTSSCVRWRNGKALTAGRPVRT